MKNEINQNDLSHTTVRINAAEKQKAKSRHWLWQITLLSLLLSAVFGLISELMLAHTSLCLALILIVLLVGVGVFFDIIGMAVTAGNIKSLLEQKSRGTKGVDIGISLVKNADKVSSICTDVIGDICSILSGAGGVAISVILGTQIPGINPFILSIIVSAVIAAINVLIKAIGKSYAISNSDKIVLKISQILSVIIKKRKK